MKTEYEHDLETPESYHLSARHIYGSSRIGMITEKVEYSYTYSSNAMVGIYEDYFAVEDRIDVVFTTTLGFRQYELSNHLGNVLSVIGDQKLPIVQSGVVQSFVAYVISSQDYSPFGVTLSGRSWSGEGYRYGFNGKEKDNEGMGGGGNTYDYGFRIYNPALAKFLSVDPLSASYPWYTPYQFAGNKPIKAIDIDGLEEYSVTGNTVIISMKFGVFQSRPNGGNVPTDMDIKKESQKNWELYNKENSSTYGLKFTYNDNGDVVEVSVGETQYTVQFDVTVEVFDDEFDPRYLEFKNDESFSGVYLFGDTEFEGQEVKSITENDGYSVPAFTDGISSKEYDSKELIAFKDQESFTKTTEVHEVGHTLGLSHWGVALGFGTKIPSHPRMDPIYGNRVCFDNDCYDSEGMMKTGELGSENMKLTQVLNALNSINKGKQND